MYLIVIAWIYVVLMMSVAEATNTTGTVLGAIVTFLLYGLGPVALVVYLMRTPERNKAAKRREAEARAAHVRAAGEPEAIPSVMANADPAGPSPAAPSVAPDAGGHPARGHETITARPGIPAVGKEP